MTAKDAAACSLIQWHFTVEPELREVYRIVLDDEFTRNQAKSQVFVAFYYVAKPSTSLIGRRSPVLYDQPGLKPLKISKEGVSSDEDARLGYGSRCYHEINVVKPACLLA